MAVEGEVAEDGRLGDKVSTFPLKAEYTLIFQLSCLPTSI